MKTIRLKNGLTVNRICACCRHKADGYPMRRCQLTGADVTPDEHCRRWEIDEKYGNARLGGGYVKTREYLMYALAVAVENEKRPVPERVEVSEIRRMYKMKTGKGIVGL